MRGVRVSAVSVFGVFALAYFLSYFFRSANAVIAGDLVREVGLSAGALGLMTSVFYLAFAAAQVPLGWGLDRWGPRFVTPGLMLVGAVGSWVFAEADSFGELVLGRALLGLGMAGILMGGLKAFSRWFAPHRFATVSGALVAVGASGALVAATPLAWLAGVLGWRAVFAWGAGVIALVALLIVGLTRNTPEGDRLEGGAVGPGGLGEVFRDARFWRMAPLALVTAGTFFAVQSLWGGPYLFDVYGASPVQAGNALFALSLAAVVGYGVSGVLADRWGVGRVMLAAGLGFAGVLGVLAAFPGELGWVGVGLVYAAFGFLGAFNIVLLAHARLVFPPHLTGRAVTAVNLFGIGGVFALQWWMGVVIGVFGRDAAGRYPPEAYALVFGAEALLVLAALWWYAPLVGERAAARRG
ncbi:MFS transporter [Marinithermus hydrothermalis]|uniref:Major facilitator superfamily MFS_1 n=1 Tax=Marinithermus hydrothermalis (strain DSM 14884 / JCM 11576 / T1) TaxID=869210 RepID=F2NQX5_MARHT|nr:MFS transporter [Marinithermus hydrothermalis]AEB12553.1 major facilitator superfamily MFS_1 [Marinithermus hydrothermalis DSM 14884]